MQSHSTGGTSPTRTIPLSLVLYTSESHAETTHDERGVSYTGSQTACSLGVRSVTVSQDSWALLQVQRMCDLGAEPFHLSGCSTLVSIPASTTDFLCDRGHITDAQCLSFPVRKTKTNKLPCLAGAVRFNPARCDEIDRRCQRKG